MCTALELPRKFLLLGATVAKLSATSGCGYVISSCGFILSFCFQGDGGPASVVIVTSASGLGLRATFVHLMCMGTLPELSLSWRDVDGAHGEF